jgi:hypothetical protein
MGHHFVPQQYLRNFEDPNQPGYIWLHDKRGGLARPASIAKVAQMKQFYSEETAVILARDVEIPSNAVIDKLIHNAAITRGERLQLAYYIGVMLKRIPARRRHAKEMLPSVLSEVVARIREQIRALASETRADPELLAKRLQEVDYAEKKIACEPPPEVLKLIREPWPTEQMLQALFDMTWRVLVSSGPQYFITTDNPAFFFRASGYGLANRESELSFPLSTTHALHGSWQRATSNLLFLKATPSIVREFNRRLVRESERLVFYHKPAPWLSEMLLKKNIFLSVIRWPNE